MRKLIYIFLTLCIISSCVQNTKTKQQDLLTRLNETAEKGIIYFGQQDATVYGHFSTCWGNADFKSDMSKICGNEPMILGFDLGGIESGDSLNLDGVPFSVIRNAAQTHLKKGGIVTFSWHPRNPVTLSNSWDTTAIVTADFEQIKITLKPWLKNVATFLNSCLTSCCDSDKNHQIIFRPWHEHTGWWFWWGQQTLTKEHYINLWHFTYSEIMNSLNRKDTKSILWAYSPNFGVNKDTYMERYPGDNEVDILGFDCYQFGADPTSYINDLNKTLAFMTELGYEHKKPIALTETGNESLQTPNWWTEVLLPVIEKYPVSYTMVWRNAYDKPEHFYVPFEGEASAEDFRQFVSNKKIILLENK